METFKDKMDDKSYQLILDKLAANQFTSWLIITKTYYLGSSRHDVFKGTNLTSGCKKLAQVASALISSRFLELESF